MNRNLRNTVRNYQNMADQLMRALHEANEKAIKTRDPEFRAKYLVARTNFVSQYNKLIDVKIEAGLPDSIPSATIDNRVNIGGFEFDTDGTHIS